MLTRAATSNLVLRGFSLSSAAQAGVSLQGVRHTAAQGNPAAVQSTHSQDNICALCTTFSAQHVSSKDGSSSAPQLGQSAANVWPAHGLCSSMRAHLTVV